MGHKKGEFLFLVNLKEVEVVCFGKLPTIR